MNAINTAKKAGLLYAQSLNRKHKDVGTHVKGASITFRCTNRLKSELESIAADQGVSVGLLCNEILDQSVKKYKE